MLRSLTGREFGGWTPDQVARLTDYQVTAILAAKPGDPVPGDAAQAAEPRATAPPDRETFVAQCLATMGDFGWTRADAERHYEAFVLPEWEKRGDS